MKKIKRPLSLFLPKILKNRATLITRPYLHTTLFIYNGKQFKRTQKITRAFLGHKVGELSLTKKLGAKIHDSERNQKRKNKKKHK